jgi:RNA polymerase sigma-70 factor (ECF subfamily)
MRPRLHRYCASITGSVIEAEDVVQEALLKAYRSVEQAHEIDDLKPWLYRIAHNAAIDYLRRRKRNSRFSVRDVDMDTIADVMNIAESRVIVSEALQRFMHLTILQRSVCFLVDVLGYSLQETSVIVCSTLAGTKAALRRGRLKLAEISEDGAVPPPSKMSREEHRRLGEYIDRFNSRDFDALRDMLGEDAQLDLVSRSRQRGREQVSGYYGNYMKMQDWRLSLGYVEGRPAILVHDPRSERDMPWSFMLIEWSRTEISAIRDFRYASYVLDAALS